MAAPFVSYQPSSDGKAVNFSTKDGRIVPLFGPAAYEQMKRLDSEKALRAAAAPPEPQTTPGPSSYEDLSSIGDYPADEQAPDYMRHKEDLRSMLDQHAGEIFGAIPQAKNDDLPSKFRTYAPPPVSPAKSFARSAVESGLDAAALPVVAASRAADYVTGRDSSMSHLSGRDAAESIEWLLSQKDPADIRREETFAEGEIPQAQEAGRMAGSYVGSAPMAALTGRVPAAGAVMSAARQRKEKPASEAMTKLTSGVDEADLSFMRDGYRDKLTAFRGVKPEDVDSVATGEMPPPGSRNPLPPIEINLHADGQIALKDGRHRLEAAQEAGATRILAKVREYGPRGSVKNEETVVIPVPRPDPNNPRKRGGK